VALSVGTPIRVAQFSRPAKQGLRLLDGDERSVHPRRNDSTDACPTSLMLLLKHLLVTQEILSVEHYTWGSMGAAVASWLQRCRFLSNCYRYLKWLMARDFVEDAGRGTNREWIRTNSFTALGQYGVASAGCWWHWQ
jgi:hypothetical protein